MQRLSAGKLRIRAYGEHDRVQLLDLWRRCFADDPPWNEPEAMLNRKLATQPGLVLVALLQERLAGSVLGGYDGVRGWMYHLVTAPDLRRQGVARALVSELERRLEALGCVKLNLQVREGNQRVAAFYRSLGYTVEPRLSLGKRIGPA